MEDSIQEYVPIIEEEFKRLGLFYNPHASGLALHRVQFHRDTKTFTYQCTEANELFRRIFSISDLADFRYESIFPYEEGTSRFDWSIVLGHAGEFYSTSYFYCYSTLLNKWIRFLVIGPRRGVALVAAEDITRNMVVSPRPAASEQVE